MTLIGMSMRRTAIDGLAVLTPKTVTDERGAVREFFRASSFAELGLDVPEQWSQINMTWTRRGAIRGLHGEAMTKVVGVAAGTAFGAYLDVRPGSRSHGTVVTVELGVGTQVLVPAGVCHGFQTTAQGCQYLYCFDAEWSVAVPGAAVNALDPALAIGWPIAVDPADPSQLSAKDAAAPPFVTLG
jgi:dTDP-4-dehydrorhamnose 3,5-epimerase